MSIRHIIFILLGNFFIQLNIFCAHDQSHAIVESIQKIQSKTVTEYGQIDSPLQQIDLIQKTEHELDTIEQSLELEHTDQQCPVQKKLSSARSKMCILKGMSEKTLIYKDTLIVEKIKIALTHNQLEMAQQLAAKIINLELKKEQLDIIAQQQEERSAIVQSVAITPRTNTHQPLHRPSFSKKFSKSRDLTSSFSQNEDFFAPYIQEIKTQQKISPRKEIETPTLFINQEKKITLWPLAIAIALGLTTRIAYVQYRKNQNTTVAQLISLIAHFDEKNTEEQTKIRLLLHNLIQELHAQFPHVAEQQRYQLWALIEYTETIEYNYISKEALIHITNAAKNYL